MVGPHDLQENQLAYLVDDRVLPRNDIVVLTRYLLKQQYTEWLVDAGKPVVDSHDVMVHNAAWSYSLVLSVETELYTDDSPGGFHSNNLAPKSFSFALI
jgi:hypothetical protein